MACDWVFVLLLPELTPAVGSLSPIVTLAGMAVTPSAFFSSFGSDGFLADFFAATSFSAVFLGAAFAVLAGVSCFSVFDVLVLASSFSVAGAVTSSFCGAYLAA